MTNQQLRALQSILVVDDDTFFRSVLAKVLTRRGYHIAEAASGEAALATLELADHQVDLVITDVVMPGMSGIRLAEQIESRYAGIRTLFMSGYSFATLQRECGMPTDRLPYFLRKPFDPDALAAKLIEVFENQRRRSSFNA